MIILSIILSIIFNLFGAPAAPVDAILTENAPIVRTADDLSAILHESPQSASKPAKSTSETYTYINDQGATCHVYKDFSDPSNPSSSESCDPVLKTR